MESREKAKAVIMAGTVYVNNQKADKAGETVEETASIEVRGNPLPFVSRGGLKLQKALQCFPIKLDDVICMDVGASTGGFTDCMLQNGARKVYSVDVGYGQLAWKLRSDERVISLERTNARYLTEEQVPEKIGFTSIDVSFISLKIILPAIYPLLAEESFLVCLIKPQFEAGKDKVGKKGVVRDRKVHADVIKDIMLFSSQNGFSVLGLTYSPVKGPEGNIEYLLYLQKIEASELQIKLEFADLITSESHAELDGSGHENSNRNEL